MTRVAVLGPTTLLGREVRLLLDAHRERWTEVALFATSEEEVGTVTESAGTAALVTEATPQALDDIELIFSCGTLEEDLPLIEKRPAGSTAVVLSPRATAETGTPVVAGVNPEAAVPGGVLVSPHPAAVALSHLLAPCAAAGLGDASATLVQPVSMFGDQGLDDLLKQARDILTMAGERRESLFDRQLAFNLYPAPEGSAGLAELVRGVTEIEAPLAIHTLQAPVFHGLSVSLFVRFADDPGEERLREALAAQSHVALWDGSLEEGEEGEPATPGPIDAAARDDVLVGGVQADRSAPGGYWIWAVMDNITRGGASNAVEIAELVA